MGYSFARSRPQTRSSAAKELRFCDKNRDRRRLVGVTPRRSRRRFPLLHASYPVPYDLPAHNHVHIRRLRSRIQVKLETAGVPTAVLGDVQRYRDESRQTLVSWAAWSLRAPRTLAHASPRLAFCPPARAARRCPAACTRPGGTVRHNFRLADARTMVRGNRTQRWRATQTSPAVALPPTQ